MPKIGTVSETECPLYVTDQHLLVIPANDGVSYFLIDTGSERTILCHNNINVDGKLKGLAVTNYRNISLDKRVDSINMGGLIIKDHDFIFMKSHRTHYEGHERILGIIGMDILSQKYGYFNLDGNKLSLKNHKGEFSEPSLVLEYEKWNRPIIELLIENRKVDNILFDTGYNATLMLTKDDPLKDNYTIFRQDTVQALLGKARSVETLKMDSININDEIYHNVNITFHKKRLLGTSFVLVFDSFFIDPYEKRINFYINS